MQRAQREGIKLFQRLAQGRQRVRRLVDMVEALPRPSCWRHGAGAPRPASGSQPARCRAASSGG